MRRLSPLTAALASAIALQSSPADAHEQPLPPDDDVEEGAEGATAAHDTHHHPAPGDHDGDDDVVHDDDGEGATSGRETVIREQRPRQAASSSTIRQRDLLRRPRLRPADILQSVPGFYVVQHAGGGKANQYFLRGFDADHGTDIALSVDGVPVNAVSHGHGQGYADLNFVIPELITRLEVKKGPYFADVGDFATAGAVDLVVGAPRESFASTAGTIWAPGRLGQPPGLGWRGLVVLHEPIGSVTPLLAAELHQADGPFENPEGYRRLNLVGRVPFDVGRGSVTLTAMSSLGGWNGSGQLPLRAVDDGRLSRFGSVDPTEGGASSRHSLSARYVGPVDETGLITARAWLVRQELQLFSNFTFFSVDPEDGDQIEQNDARTFGGGEVRWDLHRHLPQAGLESTTSVGVQSRADVISTGLHRSVARQRGDTIVDAGVMQTVTGVFIEEELRLPPWLRLIVGARADAFAAQVEDRVDLSGTRSGAEVTGLVSPRGSLVFTWPEVVDVYANGGFGFHSNDARGTVRLVAPVTPMTRSFGAELGARTRLLDSVDIAGAAFVLDLDQETVWVGDEGTTELRGATRRTGLEGELRAALGVEWLVADLDASLTDATFVNNAGNGDAVALAPTFLASGGLSIVDLAGVTGRLGIVHIADRPAIEDRSITAAGFTRIDASVAWRLRDLQLSLDVQNLLNTEWREAQFANVSRLRDETSPASCPSSTRAVVDGGAFAGCEDLHFTPGAPFNARLGLTLFF